MFFVVVFLMVLVLVMYNNPNLVLLFKGIFPRKTKDNWKYGNGHETSKPSADNWKSQTVKSHLLTNRKMGQIHPNVLCGEMLE